MYRRVILVIPIYRETLSHGGMESEGLPYQMDRCMDMDQSPVRIQNSAGLDVSYGKDLEKSRDSAGRLDGDHG